MAALHRRVVRNNVFAWSERFLASLRRGRRGTRGAAAGAARPSCPERRRWRAFRAARRAGCSSSTTTARSCPTPAARARPCPPPDLRRAAAGAGRALPATACAWSRAAPRADLEHWFGGTCPACGWRPSTARCCGRRAASWEPLRPRLPTRAGRRACCPVLEHFADRTPGSFIEEKEYALVWHYRLSDPEFGEWLANELAATLERDAGGDRAAGHARPEVGGGAPRLGATRASWSPGCSRPARRADFRLAMGDDRTRRGPLRAPACARPGRCTWARDPPGPASG